MAETATQLIFVGFDPPLTQSSRTNRSRSEGSHRAAEPDDALVSAFVRRLAAHGAAARGVNVYRYQMRSTLRAAHRLSGCVVTPVELFGDSDLLGRALVDDESSTTLRLSRWTLAQRRSAVRSFAALMRPELLPLVGEEPSAVVDRALRSVAERVGTGYRLTGGRPRQRGGFTPNPSDVEQVLTVLACEPGFVGLRNRAFFGLLTETGCRVTALQLLDGANCLVLPNDRLRLYVHEKGKAERREIELGCEAARRFLAYTEAFNRHAVSRGWRTRLHLGEPGPMWRTAHGRRWGYPGILNTLRLGCVTAQVAEFTPHALRRAFATDAESGLPRHVVAQAGGWKGLQRLDDHYVQPRESTIWRKLGGPDDCVSKVDLESRTTNAAAVPV